MVSFPISPFAIDTPKVLELIAGCVGKREQSHQYLMAIAHGCLSMLTDGVLCAQTQNGGT